MKIKFPALIAICCLIFATSCVTQKACERKFPTQSVIKDSTVLRDSVVVRDTLIKTYVTIRDTTYKDSTVIVYKDGGWQSKPVTIKGKYCDAEAFVKNGKIYITLHEGGVIELSILLRKAIIEKQVYKELWHSSATTKVIKERYVPKFVKFLAWTGGGVLLLGIGYIALLFFVRTGAKFTPFG